jgi:predicted XRE-type DNA-binding protein
MPKKNKGANNSAIASKPSPYHLTSAKWQSMQLRDLVVVKLARAIEERAFSQRQAADYLGVSQPRISDLLRGNSHLFQCRERLGAIESASLVAGRLAR